MTPTTSTRAARALVVVGVITGQALISQSEWQLARAVGWPAWVAWCAPVALGAYVLAAMIAEKGLRTAVLTSAVSVLLSHTIYAAPTVWESGQVGHGPLRWFLAGPASVVPLVIMYQIHGLWDQVRKRAKGQGQGQPKPQVTPQVSHPPVHAKPAPLSRPHLVTDVPTEALDTWVTARWESRTEEDGERARVLRDGAAKFGVSEKTVARRWDKLKTTAA